jgi:hypothetical protein
MFLADEHHQRSPKGGGERERERERETETETERGGGLGDFENTTRHTC